MRSQAATALLAVLLCSEVAAPPLLNCQQDSGARNSPPAVPEIPFSLGQPERPRGRWGLLAGYSWERSAEATRIYGNVQTAVPLLSALDVTAEAAAGNSGSSVDGAVGAYIGIPWLKLGVEYSFLDGSLPFGMTLEFALKRGGLLRAGDMVRIDYRPARQELMVGASLRFPFHDYRSSRPLSREVELPRVPSGSAELLSADSISLSPEVEGHLRRIDEAMVWMDRLLTPRFDPGEQFEASARPIRQHLLETGRSFVSEDSAYHAGLDMAFGVALGRGPEEGRRLAREAERILYEEMLVPYDRLFGQQKNPSDAGRLAGFARLEFDSALRNWPGLDSLPPQRAIRVRREASEIFRRLTENVTAASVAATKRWREKVLLWTRFGELAWLPLNWGLRAEDYDTQAEWDAVLGHLAERPFTSGNTVKYLMFEQFHLELKRMIRETERYQVTVVHDFRGVVPGGEPDIYGWDMVVDGYIEAFIRAIGRLDAGTLEALPQFFLILDEHYYRYNDSRGIMTYLENLWDPGEPPIPDPEVRVQVATAQRRLREAVEGSTALAGLPAGTLRGLLAVHVNITNRFDPTFIGDNLMKDHRKLALRDVFEEDPESGVAIFTGQGIGAHYNGSGWEDRSILVQGQALVQLKSEIRNLLFRQGVEPHEIPVYLQPRDFPPDYAERCARLEEKGWTTPVSITMNETGYGEKRASLLKAAIYNLAPPGSRILSFDSLWLSEFWAGMFVGASLRGVGMFPVAPAPVSAPSAAGATLFFLRENMDALFRAQQFFAPAIERSGGMLRVGLYAEDVPVDDLRRRISIFLEGRERDRFVREIFQLDPYVAGVLRAIAEGFNEVPLVALRLRAHPLLHLKNQLFGTQEAFRIASLPEWLPVLRAHMEIRRRQLNGEETTGLIPSLMEVRADSTSPNLLEAHEAVVRQADPDGANRSIWTWTIGSMNQDHRSLALDGEALVAVSSNGALVSFIDFMFIMAIAEWPETRAEFDALFPPTGGGFHPQYDLLKSLL